LRLQKSVRKLDILCVYAATKELSCGIFIVQFEEFVVMPQGAELTATE
jgi:hypothetical protein